MSSSKIDTKLLELHEQIKESLPIPIFLENISLPGKLAHDKLLGSKPGSFVLCQSQSMSNVVTLHFNTGQDKIYIERYNDGDLSNVNGVTHVNLDVKLQKLNSFRLANEKLSDYLSIDYLTFEKNQQKDVDLKGKPPSTCILRIHNTDPRLVTLHYVDAKNIQTFLTVDLTNEKSLGKLRQLLETLSTLKPEKNDLPSIIATNSNPKKLNIALRFIQMLFKPRDQSPEKPEDTSRKNTNTYKK